MSGAAFPTEAPSYCQVSTELDLRTLFLEEDVFMMMTRVAKWRHSPAIGDRRAKAQGLIPNVWGDGDAFLPVDVDFVFMEPWKPGAGFGTIQRDEYKTEAHEPAFTASFVIFDPQQSIYPEFVRCMEHAAMSNREYASLTLHREANPVNRDETSRTDALGALMASACETPVTLPEISFYGLSFTDAVTLRAPRWSYSW